MVLIINFSGGKDSCAMLAYLCEQYPNIPKRVIFADTGWEHPDVVQWCEERVRQFDLPLYVAKNPNKTLLSMVEKRGKFPGMQTRQCTSDLKRGPIQTWIRRNVDDPLIVNCLGIRSEESTGRSRQKKLKRSGESNSKRTIWDWAPIKDWTEKQVFDYLKAKGIPLHPVYQYLRRFSCRVCIFMTEHDLRQVAKHDPEAIEIIAKIEDKIGFTMFQKGGIKTLL